MIVDEDADTVPEGSMVWFGGTDQLPAGWIRFLPAGVEEHGERAHRRAESRRTAERLWDAITRRLQGRD